MIQASTGIVSLPRLSERCFSVVKARDFDTLTTLLGYSFHDPNLLQRALTHRSVDEPHNETLEFLGDSVLSAIVANHLYHRFPDASEGELTVKRSKIVNNSNALFQVAEQIDFYKFIRVNKSFVKSNKKAWKNLLANTVEALIGAIYIDGGYAAATEFFLRHFSPLLEQLDESHYKNFKSLLQEYLQGKSMSIPSYETIDSQGLDHTPVFTVSCSVDALQEPVYGKGMTVKEAEQQAAGRAYELLCRRNS